MAFVREPANTPTRALAIIPFATGGSETVLADGCIQGIEEYHGATVTYRNCGELFAVPAEGGASTSLGNAARIADERFDELLTLDQLGELRRFRGENNRAVAISTDVRDARCFGGPSVLASGGSAEPPWTLTLFDASDESRSLGEVTGPFGVDPKTQSFFVTTRWLEGESSLVIGSLVSP